MFNEEDDEPSYRKVERMPIYKKGWQIYELVEKIVSLVNEEDEDYKNLDDAKFGLLKNLSDQMRGDSLLICPKISGAEGGDLYDIRMENAAIIRKAAREISTACTGLEMWGYKHIEYLDLLRNEIEEFRIFFAEWVKSFDEWNYIKDDWGLFNPPGVSYDDKDPDDDIPFDPSDFFDDMDD